MSDSERYVDNQDETITDTKTGLIWAKEDSWLKEKRWVSWDEAAEYAHHLNDLALGGYNSWHLPNIEEGTSIIWKEAANKDKYGKDIKLNPVFPEGPQARMWLHEPMSGSDSHFIDLTTGELDTKYKSVAGRMAARPVVNPKK
jgi:hypothetical protein|tara:strand:- start:936 stop:1364 length:429 start_codon:yes stop_codon:yes gene_type:complete